MMASAALRAAKKEFESLFKSMERRGGGQVDWQEDWGRSDREGAPASAVTVLQQWKLEQQALLDIKSLLGGAKNTASWPGRGASKPLDAKTRAAWVQVPDLEATPEQAKRRKAPSRDSSRSKRNDPEELDESLSKDSDSSSNGKDSARQEVAPEGYGKTNHSRKGKEESSQHEISSEISSDNDFVEAGVARTPRRSTPRRAAAPPTSPSKSRGPSTPSKRSASDRLAGERTASPQSPSKRPKRGASKESPPPKPVSEKKKKKEVHPCPVSECASVFFSVNTRNCHLNLTHPSEAHKYMPIRCPKCPYACSAKKTIDAHMKSAH